MANFTGYSSPPQDELDQPTNPAFQNRRAPTLVFAALGAASVFGTGTDTQPVNEIPASLVAVEAPQYGFLDFYNDVHFGATVIDLGNVTSLQIRPLSVFNAYFVKRVLNAIVPTNAAGLVLTQPAPTPLTFRPLQEFIYQLSAAAAGPPSIAASYLFDFDVVDFTVSVIGQRVIAWTWEPDWSTPVMERLEWLNDVIETQNAKEQRRKLRQRPRWSYRFSFTEHGESRALLENALYAWGARLWALPIWPDAAKVTAQLSGGGTVVTVDTTTRDFQPGGLALIYTPDTASSETLLIATVAAGQLNLELPAVATYPAGSRVYPMRLARLQMQQPYRRPTADCIKGEAVFMAADGGAVTALSETLYRGFPVVTERFNWLEDPALTQIRKVDILDTTIREALWDDESALPAFLKTYLWTAMNRTEADTMRRWLYARQGRLTGCWCPTWARDLELVATVSAVATNIDVRHRSLTQYVNAGVNRRDLRLELLNGTVFYRRLSGFSVVDAAIERMTIDSALGVQVPPADVKLMSFMTLARLDADGIELAWRNTEVVNAIVNLRSFNNDA